MNDVLKRIIDEVDLKWEEVRMNFENDTWRESIPSEPGWYLIKTNAPVDVLKGIGRPKYKAHTNIPETIDRTSKLKDIGIAIIQSANGAYVVYNGEAGNLKARAREHTKGHPKTYCLGLSDYETLANYKWTFCYVPLSRCRGLSEGDEALRLAVEQGWRAKNGWPILCRK